MTPPARLLHGHRHGRVSILVLGGTAGERHEVVRAFHRESRVLPGELVTVDPRTGEAAFRESLRNWLSGGPPAPGGDPLLAAERGTLLVDPVGALTPETQRLLEVFLGRAGARLDAAGPGAWYGRFAAGSPEDLGAMTAEGRFLAGLYDAIDKVRIELPAATAPGGSSAASRRGPASITPASVEATRMVHEVCT